MLLVQNINYKYANNTAISYKDFTIPPEGELLVLGGSGTGKTTLLHLLGGLLSLREGEVNLNGQSYKELSGSAMDRFRAVNIGLVFQKPHLITSLNVLENLLLAQMLSGTRENRTRLLSLLDSVNLGDKAGARIHQLSQGQAQRVAILRAVVNNPALILADEPTSSLDDENAAKVLALLQQQAAENKAMLVITTHDQRVKVKIANHYLL